MILNASELLKLTSSSTAGLDVSIGYDLFSDNIFSLTQNTKISTATTTPILTAPGTDQMSRVDEIFITNTDASVSNTVIVIKYDGSSNYETSITMTLAAGETLYYSFKNGWSKQILS
jgi:hypothetical protein